MSVKFRDNIIATLNINPNNISPEPTYAHNLTTSFVSSKTWYYIAEGGDGNRITDVYKVKAGHPYLICLGEVHANRFLVVLFDLDIMQVTQNTDGT